MGILFSHINVDWCRGKPIGTGMALEAAYAFDPTDSMHDSVRSASRGCHLAALQLDGCSWQLDQAGAWGTGTVVIWPTWQGVLWLAGAHPNKIHSQCECIYVCVTHKQKEGLLHRCHINKTTQPCTQALHVWGEEFRSGPGDYCLHMRCISVTFHFRILSGYPVPGNTSYHRAS